MTATAEAEVDNDLVPVPAALEEPLRVLLDDLHELHELEESGDRGLDGLSRALVEQYVVDALACLDRGDVEGAREELDRLLEKL